MSSLATRRGNNYNFLVVFSVALGSWTYGFNGTIMGSIFGLPSFWTYFNLSIDHNGAIVGAANGAFYGGGAVGGLTSFWLAMFLGRKNALAVSCIIGIIGAVLQGGAVNAGMFLAGRALTGVCCGIFQCVVPVYQSEVSPPAQRGRMVGSHGVMVCFGAAISTWIGFGCYFASSPQVRWRLALSFGVLSPLLLLFVIYLLPESPRWLIQRGKYEAAMKILRKLHASPEDLDEILPKEEFLQISRQIELEKCEQNTLVDALKRQSTRKRLIIGTLLPFLINSSGVMVNANYQTILYENLGVSGWVSPFLLAIYISWSAILNFCNSLLLDRVGRIRMLLIGFAGGAFAMIGYTVMGALFANSNNRVGSGFGIFFIFLYTTFYGGCLDVTGYVYWTEIFPTYARAAGVAVSIVSFFSSGLIYTQVAPIAFATIQWRYYLLFIIIPLLGEFVIYFYFPETKGLSLEEISALFGDEVALDVAHLAEEQKQALDAKLAAATDVLELMDGPMSLGEKASAVMVEETI